ncbi:MAG: RNA methyltransferase [Bacteroidota bacterium]|nr:RNA methyltransferase [Candidatus Kapabacteria bacterium]MDW8220387.1 RNA methyltransferase [Bacteroidota bacterium]
MLFPSLPTIVQRHIRSLHKRSERERHQQCIIEGEHLCAEYCALVQAHVVAKPLCVVLQRDVLSTSQRMSTLAQAFAHLGVDVYCTPERTFYLLSDTTTPQGILAVVEYPCLAVETNQPMIVLDNVNDPGNVGTIIRTAEWFGVRNILLGQGSADRFHPKTLRASMGSIFRCAVASTPNLAITLQTEYSQYTLYGASVRGSLDVRDVQVTNTTAIIMGNESHGISADIHRLLHATLRITQAHASRAESLNVAVAAGIILYQCFAQRHSTSPSP